MKWKTPEPREYYAKYQHINTANSLNWFECYELPGNVIAICEPQNLQEVNAFLIFGEEKALLLDTGMGIFSIKPLVEELCSKYDVATAKAPGSYFRSLQIVNCHCHFDHTGGNWDFDEIFAVDDPIVRRQAHYGVPHEPLANQTDEDMFLYDYPPGFDPESYCIKPYTVRPCEDGHIFDLGGRNVEFITTPGHTNDHAMLYDHKYGILFAGDMIYFGAIYVQFGNDIMGYSDIDKYIASLKKIRTRCPDLKSIYVSHNDFITDKDAISLIESALRQVADGSAEGTPLQDEKYGYYMDPPTMRQYMFDGFSIVAGK